MLDIVAVEVIITALDEAGGVGKASADIPCG